MDIFRKNNKIAFTLIALTLASSSLALGGCGQSRVDVQAGGGTALTAQQRTADITVRFDSPGFQAVASEVRSFEFTLFDGALDVCYTITCGRGDLKRGCIALSGVPVSAESLVCILKDAYGNPVGLIESSALDAAPGTETVIDNPDFVSDAGLGERLSLLRLIPSAPVKLKSGEKIRLRAEGVFSCRNGAELSCDLGSCSRLVWESSNSSILRSLGGGRFKALSGGSVKAYASMGRKQAEIDVIVRAASAPPSAAPEDEAVTEDNSDSDSDPAAAAAPEPDAVDNPCSLTLDLSRSCLPSELRLEVRGYDKNNRLRFRRAEAGLKETLEADQSVTRLAGILLERDGQVYGLFSSDVNLRGKKSCSVVNPDIISGSELAAYGEMVISSERPVYDLNDEKIYEKTDGNGRCVSVRCSAEVRYTVIPGVWAYSSGRAFLEELCSFRAESSDSGEYGVFRFFEAGEYTVTVSYRGVTGFFAVTVTDSSSQTGNYGIDLDLSGSELPEGAVYELRGYSSANALLFSEPSMADLHPVFGNVDKNVTRLACVIKTADGEPYAFFEQNVSLRDGEPCQISGPALLTGEQLALQKGALSFAVSPLAYDLKNKNASGYVAVNTSPSLTYSYTEGWSESFGRDDIRDWDAFSLSCSPYLEYYSSAYKYRLKVYETGQYTISARYRGLTSQPVQINVVDTSETPAADYSVEVNFAAAGLPDDSSLIYCQLFHEGAAVSEELSRSSASSLSFDNVSSAADGIVIKVIGSSGRLAGLLYQPLSFSSEGRAVLNDISVSSGVNMDAYIKSFSAAPGSSLKPVGAYLNGTAQAVLSFNDGKIVQTRDVSAEAVWSSSDMTRGTAANSWRVTRAGESSLRASLGSGSVDLKVYASGTYNNNLYKYGQANLNSGRAVTMAIYTPDGTSSKGAFSGRIAGGAPASANLSAALLQDREDNAASAELRGRMDAEGRAEARIRAQEAEFFDSLRSPSGIMSVNADRAASYTKTIDYVNARRGDTISGIYDADRKTSYDAKVILGNEGLSLNNGYTTSGKVIILAEIKNGEPLLDLNNNVDLLQVLMIDYMLGKKNPFDREGKAVLDRIRSDVGHECGYGCGGGVSELGKVVISVADLGSTGTIAYTIATNCFPKSIYNNSNECEMITFNYAKYQEFDPASMCSNLAHEFGHLVSYNTRAFRDMPDGYAAAANAYVDRISILEEGHADLCSFLCGFGCDDRIGDFSEFQNLIGLTSMPSWAVKYASKALDRRVKSYNYLNSLSSYSIKDAGYFASSGSSVFANYGQGCFFLTYLYDRYGIGTVNRFYNSSPNDSAYKNLPYGAAHKDYDLLAGIVSEETGNAVSFADIYSDYGKALLLNSTDKAGNIPSAYRLTTLIPGKTYNSDLTVDVYKYYGNLPKVTPKNTGVNLSASDIVPWSLNYYITPNMTYSLEAPSSVFGMWGGLNSVFKMMLFNNSLNYGQDIE